MSESAGPTPRIHFEGLNPLRFLSALAILLYHSTQVFAAQLPDAVQTLLQTLALGVDRFFLISGFLIVYLLLAEKAAAGTISLPRFYLRRALRIFPLYFLIIGLAYHDFHATNPEIAFGSYACFWGNFWLIEQGQWTISLLNPLWSVCIEEQFYLVIPLLVVLLPARRLPLLFGGIMLLSLAFRCYHATDRLALYCHPLSRCDVLALGGLLACRHFQHPIRLPGRAWLALTLLALGGAYVNLLDLSALGPVFAAGFRKYLMLPLLVLLFTRFVFGRSPLLRRLNQLPVLDYLGRISYGLYMFHSVVMYWLGDDSMLYLGSNMIRVLVIFAGTVVVASLSFELFEKQFLRLKKRFEVVPTSAAGPGLT